MAPPKKLIAILQFEADEKGLKDFKRALKATERDARDFGHGSAGAFSSFDNAIKGSIASVTAAAVAVKGLSLAASAFTSSISVAANFEAEMSKVQALADTTDADLKRLTEAAVEFGAASVFSASEAARGMQSLAAAGMGTADIIAAMPGLLDAAAASGAGFEQTADLLASTLGGFGLAASEAGHASDVLAAAASASQISLMDAGESLKFVAPIAAATGGTLEETAAAITVLGKAGIIGSQAGTAMRAMMVSLIDPSKKAAELISNLGANFRDAEGKLLDFGGIARELREELGGLSKAQQEQALATLFGNESLTAAFAIMTAGGERLEALEAGFHDVDGAAAKMAGTMQKNALGAFEELKGATESLQITIGNMFLPTLTDMTKELAEGVRQFTSFVKAIEPAKELLEDMATVSLPNLSAAARTAFDWIPDVLPDLDRFVAAVKAAAAAVRVMGALKNKDFGALVGALGSLGSNFLDAGGFGVLGDASGGLITGPGGPRSDSILRWLSNGEYVLQANAVKSLGVPFLDALNATGMAGGGVVSSVSPSRSSGSKIDLGLDRVDQDLARFFEMAFDDAIAALIAAHGSNLQTDFSALSGAGGPAASLLGSLGSLLSGTGLAPALGEFGQNFAAGTIARPMTADREVRDAMFGGSSLDDPAAAKWLEEQIAAAKALREMRASVDAVAASASGLSTQELAYLESGLVKSAEAAQYMARANNDAVMSQRFQVEQAVSGSREMIDAMKYSFMLTKENFAALAPHVQGAARMFEGVGQAITDTVGIMYSSVQMQNLAQLNESAMNLAHGLEVMATDADLTDDWLNQLRASATMTVPSFDLFGQAASVAAGDVLEAGASAQLASAAFQIATGSTESILDRLAALGIDPASVAGLQRPGMDGGAPNVLDLLSTGGSLGLSSSLSQLSSNAPAVTPMGSMQMISTGAPVTLDNVIVLDGYQLARQTRRYGNLLLARTGGT